MNPSPATVLGFDFGKKRIGIAVGQTLTASARPLDTVRVQNDQPDWEAIGRLIESWRPAQLIVGLPTQLDDSEHPLAAAVRQFAAELHRRYALAVHLVDERLSSHEAAHIAVAAGGRGAPHSQAAKETLDRIAAQVILETWLAEQAYGRQPL
jgi:putative Holliday junction resolvase